MIDVAVMLCCVGANLVNFVPKEKEKTLVVTSKKDYNSKEVDVARRRGIQVVEGMSVLSAICCNSISAYKSVPTTLA